MLCVDKLRIEIERLTALVARTGELRAAAEDALSTLEAIELLDATRFGLKTEVVTASCDKLHRALEGKP